MCPTTHINQPFLCLYSSGGYFGQLEILYSTSEIDLVGLAQATGQKLVMYYNLPKAGIPSTASFITVNITGQADPLAACAAACLREQSCQAFSLSSGLTPASCTWVTSGSDQLTSKSHVMTYVKNVTATAVLLSTRAVAGSDYTPVTAQSAFMEYGSGIANLTVPILSDTFPEVDESFSIQILKVNTHVIWYNAFYMCSILFVNYFMLNCVNKNILHVLFEGRADKSDCGTEEPALNWPARQSYGNHRH